MIQTTTPRVRWTDALLGSLNTRARSRYERHRVTRDPMYFDHVYHKLVEERFASHQRSPLEMPEPENESVTAAVESLRLNGVYVWRGLFSDAAWLSQAQEQMRSLVSGWEQTFEVDGCTEHSIGDPRQGPVLLRGSRSQNGRLRATFHSTEAAPKVFRGVMQHPALRETVCRYFDADSNCNYLLAERLTPSTRGDFWHVDRIVDQVKMMVLLTDVDETQGPLRLKVGTHRYQPSLRPVYYNVFCHGVDYAYPPGPLVEQLPGEIILGTGKAGDCIVFDTLAVHSGTECREGQRDVLVGTWYGHTRRTQKLLELSNNRWI